MARRTADVQGMPKGWSLLVIDRKPRDPRTRGAFTLIEVLVVVAIIALLIAILIPSLRKVRWQARLTACQAQLHDLGNGFQMYANTSNGFFPLSPDPSTDTFCSLWRARLLKNPDLVICPSTNNVVRPHTVPYATQASTESSSDLYHTAESREDDTGGHSYEYNGCYNTDSGAVLSKAHKRGSTFVFPPHEMMLVHDLDEEQDVPGIERTMGCRPIVLSDSYASGNNCPQPWDNHGETGMNMMFGDGHAQFTRKVKGTVVDMRRASGSSIPTAQPSVNAVIEKIWLKSQYPWRYRAQ